MIQTLDLFRGLSLGMGAWEGLTVERVAGAGKRWDESQFGFYWQGQKLTGATRGNDTLESSENAREIKNEGGGQAPPIVMDTLFCVSAPSHYIHRAVKYSHVNEPTGSFVVICGNL